MYILYDTGVFHALNEAVIDRGPSPYLSALDVACDSQYLTTVQGDGVIVSTIFMLYILYTLYCKAMLYEYILCVHMIMTLLPVYT